MKLVQEFYFVYLFYRYMYESPSQILMQVVCLMYMELKDVPEEDLKKRWKTTFCVMTICVNLTPWKLLKRTFPCLPHSTWCGETSGKLLIRLHLAKHKHPKCKEEYSADETFPPGNNTMVAEQTFSWFSRFKKIANSMSQTHHLFFIHRNIKRRNTYTAKCRRKGKEPVLPGINAKLLLKLA